MSKELVLVGNGSNLLDKPLGNLIDEHETVIRLNAYKTKGFERYVGNHTHIWVRHPYVQEHRVATESYVKISRGRPMPPHNWKRPGDRILGDFGQIYIEKVLDIIPSKKWCWSTGIHALAHFSMMYEKINFCGFGQSTKKKHIHYYPDGESHTLHKFPIERQFIDFLISLGRATEL